MPAAGPHCGGSGFWRPAACSPASTRAQDGPRLRSPASPVRRRSRRAPALRQLAIARGDQPYGAVVVKGGRIVGEGVSAVVTDADPTAHAERQAIRDAQRRAGTLDLSGCVLYGTSRACPQCEAAAQAARIARMYYGSAATDAGVPGSR
ncbi:MAG: nucleoside deaminase [Betaproteobacteria bacterium]|nr:nucleoside deaminase [Betaproteobacteria bacterium]